MAAEESTRGWCRVGSPCWSSQPVFLPQPQTFWAPCKAPSNKKALGALQGAQKACGCGRNTSCQELPPRTTDHIFFGRGGRHYSPVAGPFRKVLVSGLPGGCSSAFTKWMQKAFSTDVQHVQKVAEECEFLERFWAPCKAPQIHTRYKKTNEHTLFGALCKAPQKSL